MQVAEALDWASKQLVEQEGRADASALLLFVLNKPRSYLFSWPEAELSAEQEHHFFELVTQRKQGQPVAHLLGEREFWSLPFKVNPSTLIPRPDTETLVEWALELVPNQPAQVMDLGTGTGAIALALASERPAWKVLALDVQADAVALAQQNTNALELESRVQVRQSDWFEAVEAKRDWDLIVSNPPYIEEGDHHLMLGDVRFEPKTALTSGRDGLDAIRQLIHQAPDYLVAGGWLLLEHGFEQAQAVAELLAQRGFEHIQTRQDLGGQPRITSGCWGQAPSKRI